MKYSTTATKSWFDRKIVAFDIKNHDHVLGLISAQCVPRRRFCHKNFVKSNAADETTQNWFGEKSFVAVQTVEKREIVYYHTVHVIYLVKSTL